MGVLLAAWVAALAAAAPAHALTYNVTSTTDSNGACVLTTQCPSIRSALAAAALQPGTDTIAIPAGTYSLSLGQLTIGSDTVRGASARSTLILGDGKTFRIFRVPAGTTATITRVTIAGGAATSGDEPFGGGVMNRGTVTLEQVRVALNSATLGGGVANLNGTMTIQHSLIDNNNANSGAGDGGGILNYGAQGPAASLGIVDSTVAFNTGVLAGGIMSSSNPGNSTALQRVTIADNTAGPRGVGGILFDKDEKFEVRASIVARNLLTAAGAPAPVPSNCEVGVPPQDLGSNVESGEDCSFKLETDRQNTTGGLSAALVNAGGETNVLTIPGSSVAVDRAPACKAEDQRGKKRPEGPGCDAGAYEVAQPPDTRVETGPAPVSSDRTPQFTFSSPEPGVSFECRLEGPGQTAGFIKCASPRNYDLTQDGDYVFHVRAVDQPFTDDTPAAWPFTVDTQAPDAPSFTSPPDNGWAKTSTVTLSGTAEPGSTVAITEGEVSRGSTTASATGTWSRQIAGVLDGDHIYTATATDAAKNTSVPSGPWHVRVDTVKPNPPAITAPADNSLQTSSTVTLSGTAEPNATVEVFDGAASRGTTTTSGQGSWTRQLPDVPDGSHTYTARATDPAGNTSEPSAVTHVTVDTGPPDTAITGGPSGPTSDPAPSFSFGSSETGSTFACKLDGPGAVTGTFAPCVSPKSFGGLAPGDYVFSVRETDAAGRQTTVSRSFTVTALPQATPTPSPSPTPTPAPAPQFHQTVVVTPVSGRILVRRPGTKDFVELDAAAGIPLGSTLDTKGGVLELTSVPSRGGAPQKARFFDGIFKVTQPGSVTELTLNEPLAACRRASAAAKKPKTRRLWGDGAGNFRTRGQYSSATVRGTKWLVQDTCAGTLTRVTRGVVAVRDNVKRKTVVVRAGKRYLARPRR